MAERSGGTPQAARTVSGRFSPGSVSPVQVRLDPILCLA